MKNREEGNKKFPAYIGECIKMSIMDVHINVYELQSFKMKMGCLRKRIYITVGTDCLTVKNFDKRNCWRCL